MSQGKILVVEDDFDISNMLRIYFQSQGYQVSVAARGGDALEMCRQQLPHIIVLDIMLPDMDGYDVCRALRENLRTRHIPIIFLTQKDERSDKIHGLELGADDYITKPFDVEELKLRVRNALERADYKNQTDTITGRPSGKLIEEQLRQLMRRDGWAIVYLGLNGYDAFNEVYGFVAGSDVLRFTSLMIGEAVDSVGTANDFIGHVGGDNFLVITLRELAEPILAELVRRFDAGVGTHYDFRARHQGYIVVKDGQGNEQRIPLMTLSAGIITAADGPFADIREITEAAADARRKSRVRL